MLNYSVITEYTDIVSLKEIVGDVFLEENQFGRQIFTIGQAKNNNQNKTYHIALLGVPDYKGSHLIMNRKENEINFIRKHFYSLFQWHPACNIIDLGNVKTTDTLEDTYNAIKIIATECINNNVVLLLLGGSHDNILGGVNCLQSIGQPFNYCNIDAIIDLNKEKRFLEDVFLEQIFFDETSVMKEYTHLAFQSYYTHPKLLEILNGFRYDCLRLGYVKDQPYEIEPYIRQADIISFDMNAISNAFSPVSKVSPNGLSGEEACLLMRFIGMSNQLKVAGIFGYYSFLDHNENSAQLIAQMMWYLVEGIYFKMLEGNLEKKDNFNIFHTSFTQINATFYQNKITKRWWSNINNKVTIPCSYNDYLKATKNEIPDRWLKINY